MYYSNIYDRYFKMKESSGFWDESWPVNLNVLVFVRLPGFYSFDSNSIILSGKLLLLFEESMFKYYVKSSNSLY